MSQYTRPEFRDALKERIMQGIQGGKAGQWSARKAQLLAAEYKRRGGDYHGKKTTSQRHLDAWTDEKWTTSDGTKAVCGDKTKRYLPAEAWNELSPAQKKSTEKKKQAASKRGKQYVGNTVAAKKARKKASRRTKSSNTRSEKKWPAAHSEGR